ncbi:MAG: elongation factor P, partial [Chloroflexi bacterium]|nr:elongation factor P [Chloroflexota bacterium]
MITAGDFKRGVVVDIGGDLFQVVEYAHSKVAQRANMVRFKLKSLKDGR